MRRYWVMNCQICHNSYTRVADGQLIGAPCTHQTRKKTDMSTKDDLEYYLGRKPSSEEIQDADDWATNNPGVGLAEYVDAMKEIGAL